MLTRSDVQTLGGTALLQTQHLDAESGVPGYDSQSWYGFVVAAKTPQPIIARLNSELTQILNTPEASGPLLKLGMEVWTMTPETFAAYIKSEYDGARNT
jgi:tripartite-type tricarboxylate transporter receptor subunit TctC